MKAPLKSILPFLIPVAGCIVLVIYFANNYKQIQQLEIAFGWLYLLLIVNVVEKIGPAALLLKKILSYFNIRLNYWEAVGLIFVTGMGNYIVPYVGGVGLRGAYLKKRYNFPWSYFTGTAGGALLLSTLVNSLIGTAVVIFLFVDKQLFHPEIFLIFVSFIVIVTVLLFVPIRRIKAANRVTRKINQVVDGWKIIRSRGKVEILIMLVYLTLSSLFSALFTYVAFRVVTDGISFSDAIIIASMTTLSKKISVTPAGLGIIELVTVITSSALGYVLVYSVAVAVIQRLASTIVYFGGGTISGYFLSRFGLNPPPAGEGPRMETERLNV